jgi:hypothetical protein
VCVGPCAQGRLGVDGIPTCFCIVAVQHALALQAPLHSCESHSILLEALHVAHVHETLFLQ